MLERLTYNNFKNLAESTAKHAYITAEMCGSGLIAGSVVAVLNPSNKSNLPAWALDMLSKTNNTAITYLSKNLDATYVVAPAVTCAVGSLMWTIFKPVFSDESDPKKKNLNTLWALIGGVSFGILSTSVCSRLGYSVTGAEFFWKGIGVPMFTCIAAQNILDTVLPLPEEKQEESEIATV